MTQLAPVTGGSSCKWKFEGFKKGDGTVAGCICGNFHVFQPGVKFGRLFHGFCSTLVANADLSV